MEDKLKILGISRGEIYSPNHINNDGMIFQQTVTELRSLGATVEIMDEITFQKSEIKTNVLFSMARNPESLNKLIEMENNGSLVINSANAIYNCYRSNLSRILIDNSIAYPTSIIVNTNDVVWEELNVFDTYPVWIKRGDVHAIHKEDVVLVYSLSEANNVLAEFYRRGIKDAVIMEHIDGDIIKFYGVRESGFFHCFNLLDSNHTKFNIEREVNNNNHTPFNYNDLQKLTEAAACLAGVYIYGGDVIVRKDGSLCLIDLNDWPSFAPVRDIASAYIAKLIYNQAIRLSKDGLKPIVIQNQIA